MPDRILGELRLDHVAEQEEQTTGSAPEPPLDMPGMVDKTEAPRPAAFDRVPGSLGPKQFMPKPAAPIKAKRKSPFVWFGILAVVFVLVVWWCYWRIPALPSPKSYAIADSAALSPSPTATPAHPAPLPLPGAIASPAAPSPKPSARPSPAISEGLPGWWFALPLVALLIWLIVRARKKPKEDLANEWTDSAQASVRVSIGETRCLREGAPKEGGLLVADDLKAYVHLNCVFYRLEFSLTMLPDPDRSIERGELSLDLVPDNRQAKLPFFVRLHPDEEIVVEKKKLTRSGDGKATFKIPTIGEVGGGAKVESESELEVETVTIMSWGAGEQNGGWRFNATATRSIKTSITGLTALVAIPAGQKAKGRFRAAAHLRSISKSRLEPGPEAFIEYEFPPTLDIGSVPDPVPEYV
jgi:hypothetical protein